MSNRIFVTSVILVLSCALALGSPDLATTSGIKPTGPGSASPLASPGSPARPISEPSLLQSRVLHAFWSTPLSGQRTITVLLQDQQARIDGSLDGVPWTISLEGGASIVGSATTGVIVELLSPQRAIVALAGGTLVLTVTDSGTSKVAVTFPDHDLLGVRAPRAVAPPPETAAPSARTVSAVELPSAGQPGPSHEPFELPYLVTDVAFDPVRPYIYASSRFTRTVYFVNLETGLTERAFPFELMPESVAVSPDGTRLFVCILAQDHAPYWWPPRWGFIASWDLATGTLDRYVRIDEDPYDIAVASAGFLVVSPGSGQSALLRSYDPVTGSALGGDWDNAPSRLLLHPGETRVYTGTTNVQYENHGYDRFELHPDGQLAYATSRYFNGAAPHGDLWATPDGAHLVADTGSVYESAAAPYVDLQSAGDLTSDPISSCATDPANGVLACTSGGVLRFFNASTLIEFADEFVPMPVQCVGLHAGSYFTVAHEGDGTRVRRYSNPAPNGASNTPPTASFTFAPESPTTNADVVFDASASTDLQDPTSALRFRWDVDGDGTWDTPFLATPVLEHRYLMPRSVSVRLQVADGNGAAAETVQSFEVAFAPDPGTPGSVTTPYELPFVVADVVFDPLRPYAYVSSRSERYVYFVNLETGLIDRMFHFGLMPESLALTPDGSRLYATLLTRDHVRDAPWGTPFEGYIATWDLNTSVMDRMFHIDVDPFDLVATESGSLLVPGGSGYEALVDAFDGETGALTGQSAAWSSMMRLAVAPDGSRVYTVGTFQPFVFERIDLLPEGDLAYRGMGSWNLGRVDGNLWIFPDGARLITRGGDLFGSSPDFDQDMTFVGPLTTGPIESVAFDAANGVMATAEDHALRYYNLTNLEEFGSEELPETASFVGFSAGHVCAVSLFGSTGIIRAFAHPAPNGSSNTAPHASFVVTPAEPTTRSELTFDAAPTIDAEDPITALRFRWDFDGDGTWDTPFRTDPVATHRFPVAGTKTITLQVMDRSGLVDSATQAVDVAFGPDPGEPASAHEPFQMPYTISDVVFDPARPYMYATSKENRLVYFVNLETGLAERVYRFELLPESVSITPDGARLYVGALLRDHDASWEDHHAGALASWDLSTQVMDRYFDIPEDPFALVALSSGAVLVSGGSGQWWSLLHLFDGQTGAELSSVPVHPSSFLTLAPGGTTIYSSNPWRNPYISHFDLDGGGLVHRWDEPYVWPQPEGRTWALPDGQHLVTSEGGLFSATGDPETDMRYLQRLSIGRIAALSIDAPNRLLVTAEDHALRFYNAIDLLEFGNVALDVTPTFVGVSGNHVYAISNENWRLLPFAHPAPDGAVNTPPHAAVVLTPANPTTRETITFDAGTSTDAEDTLAQLRFRWDLDGDGTWDTDFVTDPTITRRFRVFGARTVRLQVMDRDGLVGEIEQPYDVTFAVDPGEPGPAHLPFELPYSLTDAAFDARRPYVYVSSKAEKTVSFVNVDTGLVERVFRFDLAPESLTLSPDGTRLFAAVLAQEHVPTWSGRDQHDGYIAAWDLGTRSMDRYVHIAEDPFDIVATPSGHIVVTSGSGQWTNLRVFDGVSGVMTGGMDFVRPQMRLALAPDGQRVYAADRDNLHVYDLLPGGGIQYRWEWRYYGGSHRAGGNVWISPGSDRLITPNGEVFTASTAWLDDMNFIRQINPIGFADVAFDARFGTIFTQGTIIEEYDLRTLARLDSFPNSRGTGFLGKRGKKLVHVSANAINDGPAGLYVYDINHVPVAEAGPDVVTECNGDNAGTVTFDGSASTDPDSDGTYDDLVSWTWWDAGTLVADGVRPAARLVLGQHQIQLDVRDASSAIASDTLRAEVRDTHAPVGSVIAPHPGACFGPAALPVLVQDGIVDTCDPWLQRTYDPGPGPSYASHGDHVVAVTATDHSGHAARASVNFTIDVVAPQVLVKTPPAALVIGPAEPPMSVLFTSADDDMAAGDVTHEVVELDGCVIWDGATYGNRDGRLSDETLTLNDAEICRAAAACGWTDLRNPLLRVRAWDCGANEGSDSRVLRGGYTNLPAFCGQ